MNKWLLTIAVALLAAFAAFAARYPGASMAGGLTSPDHISIGAEPQAEEESEEPSSGGGRPLLRAPAPPNATGDDLGFIAISVTGLTATKTVDGEPTECKEVILYYWFSWDATGYHPYIIFSRSLYTEYTRWEVQDAAENIGSVTIGDETYPYAWRTRCWIPTSYTDGYFRIYLPDEYDGDPIEGSSYAFMTNGVSYVRKGLLSRSDMVVTNFNPAAFTIFAKNTNLTPTRTVTKQQRLLMASAVPIVQDTTDYTFDDPVQFNNLVYFTDWSSLRVGTNNLENVLAGLDPEEQDPTVYAWAKEATKPEYGWSEITNKPNFATVATTGAFSDLVGNPTTLAGYGITDAVSTTDGGEVNGVVYFYISPVVRTTGNKSSAFTSTGINVFDSGSSYTLTYPHTNGTIAVLSDIPAVPDVSSYYTKGETAGAVSNIVTTALVQEKLGVYLYIGQDGGIYVHTPETPTP